MSNDMIAQTGLKEPERVDWDNYGKTYVAPPPALGVDGNPIVYYGVVDTPSITDADEGYLNVLLDPLKLTRAGQYDGYVLRFTRASVKPFMKNGTPIKGNPNKLANFLRACGLQVKPQTNAEYTNALAATKGKTFGFTIDWEAYNRDTQEKVSGYLNFPEDPDRPGQRKSILKAGDVVTERDKKGNVTGTHIVESEVLFANARLRFFKDATPKVTR